MVDKAMKSLEEVIKYKLNFLPVETEPFYAIQTYRARRRPNSQSYYEIYRTKNTIFSNDSYSLMEDITPLFIYISSCDKYYRDNGHGEIFNMGLYLIMPNSQTLMFSISNVFCDLDEHIISDFKERRNDHIRFMGYDERYTRPFKIHFEGFFRHFQTEEERLDSNDEENLQNEREIQKEFPINDSKTFKSDQCVICLEEELKVLFCNCGHLCICEKCASHRYDNCPVCKKENTILRIIE